MSHSKSNTSGLSQISHADWANYLNQLVWDHAVDLTAVERTAIDPLIRRFVNWIRKLARVAQRAIPYFYAVESHSSGAPHIHSVVAGTRDIRCEHVADLWGRDQSCVREYDPGRGAAGYFSKSVLEEGAIYDVSRRMPPRRVSLEPLERKGRDSAVP